MAKKESYVLINGVKWTPELVKEKILTSDEALKRALLRLYSWQTQEEKQTHETRVQNGQGFNGNDAPILTSFATQLETKGWLSPKQIAFARKRLPKYAKQIFNNVIMKQRQETYQKFGV